MKRVTIFLSILLLVLINTSCNKKIVPNNSVLCSGESFILNSVNKTTLLNGINRNSFTTKIPERTKFIIIRVQVDNRDSEQIRKSSIELLSSLAESNTDSYFKLVGGATVLALMPPQTGRYCDFFVFPDKENFIAYTKEGTTSNWENSYKKIQKLYKKLNTQSFSLVIDVKDLDDPENIYLGFLNHNLFNACRVFLDVIAIK